jgi:hypothetical protein
MSEHTDILEEIKANLVWRDYKAPGPFSETHQTLFWGKWPVGSWWYNATSKEDRDKPYVPDVGLPGIHIKRGVRFETGKQAAECVERVVANWIKGTGFGDD